MNNRNVDWNHLLADVCFLQGFREQLQITYNRYLKVNTMITKEDLKQEIDSGYLELVFNLFKQFPHQSKPDPRPIEYTGNDDTINDMTFTEIVDSASLSPIKPDVV
jgi:hypothetical protein